MRRRTKNRRGAGLVEFALVAPVLFMMLIGTVIGTIGVFQYQQVAQLAREASRYASVHGNYYSSNSSSLTTAATDINTNAIAPYATGLNVNDLNSGNGYPTVTWLKGYPPGTTSQPNTVTVTVIYTWHPLLYFPSSTTFSSTSVAVVTN
jgi:Flp pilus assembly protein TadG